MQRLVREEQSGEGSRADLWTEQSGRQEGQRFV
jgi:hypothetical protein